MTLDFVSLMMVQVIGEFNGISIPVQPLRERSNDFSATINAKMLNPFGDSPFGAPSIGSTGVIIQKNKDDMIQAFWLGNLVSGECKPNDKEASLSKDESKISISEKGLTIEHENGGITQDSISTKIKHNSNFLELANENATFAITSDNIPVSLLELSPRENKLISEGSTNIRSLNDVMIQSKKGSIIFTGEYSDEKYKPILDFNVNSHNLTLGANGGPIYIEGGKVVVNISDPAISHSIPGLGGSTALEVSIISGDIDISNNTGNIYLNACNATSIGIIQIKNGSLLSPTTIMDTIFEMGVNYISLVQENIPLTLQSSITMKNANIAIESTAGIDVSTDQAVTVYALTNVEIESIVKAAIQSAKIEIISDVQTTLKSALTSIKTNKLEVETALSEINSKITNITGQVLNITNAKMLKTGPKVVSPSAQGPLNCILICPWNGNVHAGEEATG